MPQVCPDKIWEFFFAKCHLTGRNPDSKNWVWQERPKSVRIKIDAIIVKLVINS